MPEIAFLIYLKYFLPVPHTWLRDPRFPWYFAFIQLLKLAWPQGSHHQKEALAADQDDWSGTICPLMIYHISYGPSSHGAG